MAKKTIITAIVLIAVLALLFWYQQSRKDDDVSDQTQLSISVFNQTRNADGSTVAASPKDVLVYTLTVQNTSDDAISGYVVETSIDDISELATLTDAAGANYNATTNALMWTPLDIPANGSIEKTFTVRVKDTLPTDSDFVMTTSFGGEVAVNVASQPVAVNPTPTPTPNPTPTPTPSPYQAPTTGPSAWFAALLAVMFTVGILMYRAGKKINV
jgi:uncharacterized repeat protein (TIGR01451 family)